MSPSPSSSARERSSCSRLPAPAIATCRPSQVSQLRGGLEQVLDAHPRHQSPGREDEPRSLRDAEAGARLLSSLRAEDVGVHRAVDLDCPHGRDRCELREKPTAEPREDYDRGRAAERRPVESAQPPLERDRGGPLLARPQHGAQVPALARRVGVEDVDERHVDLRREEPVRRGRGVRHGNVEVFAGQARRPAPGGPCVDDRLGGEAPWQDAQQRERIVLEQLALRLVAVLRRNHCDLVARPSQTPRLLGGDARHPSHQVGVPLIGCDEDAHGRWSGRSAGRELTCARHRVPSTTPSLASPSPSSHGLTPEPALS